jgi:DNA-binding IclR family transcriptional regulator
MDDGLRLFGSHARTLILLAVALLEQSYPRELAKVADVPLSSTQRIVNDLELQGVLASRLRGSQREVRLNPKYFAAKELLELLMRLSLGEPELRDTIESLRLRPRRAGKAL